MCDSRLCSSALSRLRSENQGKAMNVDRPVAVFRDTFYSRAGEKFAICFFDDGNQCRCPEEACRASRCLNLPGSSQTSVSPLYRGTSPDKHEVFVLRAIRHGNEIMVEVVLDGHVRLLSLEAVSLALIEFSRVAFKVVDEIEDDMCEELIR